MIEFGARPSNGTMGEMMSAQTCWRCIHDHNWSHRGATQEGESCPILMSGLFGEYSYPSEQGPPEWGYDPDDGRWTCLGFRKCTKCDPDPPDDRPQPPKPIPGQGVLFDMPEHALVYRDVLIDAGLWNRELVDA